MTDAERLRTRLMIAAQKFATEVADAVLEATGEPAKAKADEAPKRRRAPTRTPPATPAEVDPAAAAKAASALAKLGIRQAG